MSAPRIVAQVSSCKECPHYAYYSGGMYECRKADAPVRDSSIIAPFCPLPEYPARIIAGLDATVRALRGEKDQGFWLVLLSHVATKLNLSLSANGESVNIPFENGKKTAYLMPQGIVRMEPCPLEIEFVNTGGGEKFRLIPDSKPPKLYIEVPKKDLPRGVAEATGDKTFWEEREIG